MSSVTGEKLKLSVFGESHGEAIGCVIDGFPAGIKLDYQKIEKDMHRRAAKKNAASTPRLEKDKPEILSGVLDGVTTGAPIAMIIRNENVRSGDYKNVKNVPRPSHSDYTAYVKYGGNNDIRGGGHFSGRLTAPLVFAGALAKQALEQRGIYVGAHIKRIGGAEDESFDFNNISKELLEEITSKDFSLIDSKNEDKMLRIVEESRKNLDSVGGVIECAIIGVPAGVGGNMFDTVEGRLSKILFGVPAVKGVEFGLGFGFSSSHASKVNDGYEIKDGKVALISNNNGGVLGGITSGAPIVFRVVVKPTPSISRAQRSVNLDTMTDETLEIKGRHDACIVPRAVPVIEAAAAFEMLDMIL